MINFKNEEEKKLWTDIVKFAGGNLRNSLYDVTSRADLAVDSYRERNEPKVEEPQTDTAEGLLKYIASNLGGKAQVVASARCRKSYSRDMETAIEVRVYEQGSGLVNHYTVRIDHAK